MKTSDFDYFLPDDLIAQAPLAQRTDSRLLYVPSPISSSGLPQDLQFTAVVDLLQEGDLLVLNDTRVIPARLFGQKQSGGKLEVLVERITAKHTALCHIRCSRSPKPGAQLLLENAIEAEVTGRQGALFEVSFAAHKPVLDWLQEYGHMPLPPYIERADDEDDQERYQTVFADKVGAVAAPTAGLHFDDALLNTLKDKGVKTATVTLHVGAGTFQPVKADDISEHVMHAEWIDVPEKTADLINATKQVGGRVVAIGTTVVRCLESLPLQDDGAASAWQGETSIFINPGYQFRFIDVLVTNFHLPKSTLLMLVSAFAGYPRMMDIYRHAVEQQYRFFSYGDAMLLERADK